MMLTTELRIDKPWGYEIILSPAQAQATAKILHLKAGCRFSLQYHEIKEETLTLFQGKAKIIWGKDENNLNEEEMQPSLGYFIPRGLIHRVCAITDCDIFESSTPEKGTTVRLQDDYHRGNEAEGEREKTRNSK